MRQGCDTRDSTSRAGSRVHREEGLEEAQKRDIPKGYRLAG
jgi:hypothetical protein